MSGFGKVKVLRRWWFFVGAVSIVGCGHTPTFTMGYSTAPPSNELYSREYHHCPGGGDCPEGWACTAQGACEWCGDNDGVATRCTDAMD